MKIKILGIMILILISFVSLVSAAEGDYISNFTTTDVTGIPSGIATCSNHYIIDEDCGVFNYTKEGNYIDSITLANVPNQCFGIACDETGNSFLVADPIGYIHNFTMDGTYINNFTVVAETAGVTIDGASIWTCSYGTDKAYNYTKAGVHVNNFSTSETINPDGIITNGTDVWVISYTDDESHRYSVNGVYNYTFSLETLNGNSRGISTDETSIWVADSGKTVFKYEGAGAVVSEASINLTSPVDNADLSTNNINFTASYTATGYNFTNATYYVWNSTGLFNNSMIVNVTGTSNSSTVNIAGFILGNYEWNVLACWETTGFSNCSFVKANYSFSIGATINEISYTGNVYETSSQTFTANISLLSGSEISLAQLVYNGTIYDISEILTRERDIILNKTIDIPGNPGSFKNATNDFWFSFTYTDVVSTNQNTSSSSQNVSFILLQLCNATYNTQSINFSIKTEINRTLINPATNNTDIQFTFEYWLGSGTQIKNYSYESLGSSTNNTYEICIYPNKTFKVNMDMIYSAQAYDERSYILKNASITNITSAIDLFLLYDNLATKFTIEVRQGVSILKDAIVTVARFFTGEGSYRTISIRKTDESGQFVEYLDLDNDYRYSIVKDGILLGVVDKKSTCTEAPCEFTLQVAEDIGNIFAGYADNYARNVYSNLSFDLNTKIFTYDFIDITGLAQYFRLRVNQGAYNGTGVEICNQQIFSSSGSMTCNVTGYEGNFVAVGTVSRSPELITDILETTLDFLRDSLGLMAIIISFAIILTITLAGAVLSGGNPSMVLGGFGLGLLATKLMTLLPFSWGLVALFELVILIIMGWLKT